LRRTEPNVSKIEGPIWRAVGKSVRNGGWSNANAKQDTDSLQPLDKIPGLISKHQLPAITERTLCVDAFSVDVLQKTYLVKMSSGKPKTILTIATNGFYDSNRVISSKVSGHCGVIRPGAEKATIKHRISAIKYGKGSINSELLGPINPSDVDSSRFYCFRQRLRT
jgi:hypothetical protein